jgi:hypothetical protein
MATRFTFLIWAIVLGWCLRVPLLLGQTPDPLALLERVKARHAPVRDFHAEVAIAVDVDFLRVPVKRAQVFYQQPDTWKFKAKDFLMIPKKGVKFSVAAYLDGQFSAFYVTSTVMDQTLVDVVKILPLTPENELVLATLWIDRTTSLLRHVEAHTRSAGTYQVHFVYASAPFDLPVQTVITFEISRMQLPLKYVGRLKVDLQKLGDKAQGTVTLTYTNFKVNEGSAEAGFAEEETKSSEWLNLRSGEP